MAGIGYISSFDGQTISNGASVTATLKALNHVGDTKTVVDRIVTLPNGTVVNLDGTEDAATSPGKCTQKVRASATVLASYLSISGKKGLRGTLTKTLLATGTETCTAVCMDVRIVEPFIPEKDIMFFEVDFNLETEWA